MPKKSHNQRLQPTNGTKRYDRRTDVRTDKMIIIGLGMMTDILLETGTLVLFIYIFNGDAIEMQEKTYGTINFNWIKIIFLK